MAITPERRVKNRVVAILKEYGVYYFFPVTGGYGASGVPDIVVCFGGKFLAIECKAGNNKPTMLQAKNIAAIQAQGGVAVVICENNVDDVRTILEGL